jgi:hypothetical protein
MRIASPPKKPPTSRLSGSIVSLLGFRRFILGLKRADKEGTGQLKKSISTQQTQSNLGAVISILTGTPDHLARLSTHLTLDALQTPLGPGERSFTETLAHMINVEALSSESITLALLLHEPLIPDIHPERDLGKLLRYDRFEFADLLAYFMFRRKVLLRVLADLTDAQWSRTIREAGKQRQETVYWRARGLALHELEHLTDLESKMNHRATT